jgi:hypothetical protein
MEKRHRTIEFGLCRGVAGDLESHLPQALPLPARRRVLVVRLRQWGSQGNDRADQRRTKLRNSHRINPA